MGIWSPTLDNVFEIYNARNWTWTENEHKIQTQVTVPYNYAYQLVKDIIENDVRAPDLNPSVLFSNLSGLWLESANIQPLAVSNNKSGTNDYYLYNCDAIVTLQYSTFPTRNPGTAAQNFILRDYFEEYSPSVEHQTLDYLQFYWGTKPTTIPLKPKEAPIRQWISGTYTVYWYSQEKVPDEYFNLIGSVNSNNFKAFVVHDVEFQAEQMLYFPAGYSKSLFWKPEASNTIERGYNYVCKWLVKTADYFAGDDQPSWNKFYRQDKGTASDDSSKGPIWDEIVLKSDPTTIYKNFPVKDHTLLLPPAYS